MHRCEFYNNLLVVISNTLLLLLQKLTFTKKRIKISFGVLYWWISVRQLIWNGVQPSGGRGVTVATFTPGDYTVAVYFKSSNGAYKTLCQWQQQR